MNKWKFKLHFALVLCGIHTALSCDVHCMCDQFIMCVWYLVMSVWYLVKCVQYLRLLHTNNEIIAHITRYYTLITRYCIHITRYRARITRLLHTHHKILHTHHKISHTHHKISHMHHEIIAHTSQYITHITRYRTHITRLLHKYNKIIEFCNVSNAGKSAHVKGTLKIVKSQLYTEQKLRFATVTGRLRRISWTEKTKSTDLVNRFNYGCPLPAIAV